MCAGHAEDRTGGIAGRNTHDHAFLAAAQTHFRSQRIDRELLHQPLHDLSGKRRALRIQELTDGFVRKQSSAVRTWTDQRIKDIDQSDDLRQLIDLPPLQTIRVSLPLPTFMRLQHHFSQPGIVRTETLDHATPQARMLLDQGPLLGGQASGFRQQVLRHGENADVMQESRQGEAPQLRAVIAQADPDLRGQNSDIDEIRHERWTHRAGQRLNDQLIVFLNRIDDETGKLSHLRHVHRFLLLNGDSHPHERLLSLPIVVLFHPLVSSHCLPLVVT